MANGGADEAFDDRARRTRTRGIVLTVAVIVVADQLTKAWAVSALKDGPKNLIGDTVKFELARNSGSAFSRFQGYTPVLAVLALGITFVLFRVIRQTTDRRMIIGLTLVLGGALGNLGDRLFRAPGFLRGHVIDFVAVGWWPLFNIADSCISVGAVVLILGTLFAPDHDRVGK